ncbi:MAG: hypothetical protein ACYC99_15375 [Candidatus Geothermincolia bacterium]
MAEWFRRTRAPYAVTLLFALMLVTGLMLGGFDKVLANGIVICLDCIGLI